MLEGTEPPLTLRRENQCLYFGHFFPCTPGLFPAVRDFLCIIPTEQVLNYRNLGLYYGLPSGTLPLYSGPCLGVKGCNLRGHLQGCQLPDIENSRKTAEKGAEWVTVKQPKNSRENSRNTRKTAEKRSKQLFFGVSAVFRLLYRDPLPFRLFFGCFQCRAFGTSAGGRGDCNLRVVVSLVNLGVSDLCHFALISPYSNRAVQNSGGFGAR